MRSPRHLDVRAAILTSALLICACSEPLHDIPERTRSALPCLKEPVEVLFTEFDHPHVYAESDSDLACAVGYLEARDRFFEMEMARRFGLGRLSELVGEQGLSTDVQNRTIGMKKV